MYSELIYTRCRQGIDILKEGRPIASDGFKVYACSSALWKDDSTDLQFLFSAAQAKQPYSEPNFMDDAYLYYVPEKGSSFLLNFYPIPFDPNATGDYAHRAGNFVNQILAGDYSGFYPFELFRDNAVWNAKSRGEAYYYENAPTDLPQRNDILDPVGQLGIEEIGAFISNGRREALMAAVSFLISQFGLPQEERKFLVIKDESSLNIEMWIAAIEHAFSPRIAASIPFATRMDKFTTTNRYTVNQMGVYQTQINLQDRNQMLRYRAMIVGVDERDRTNAGAARPLANAPFVLLDGREKKAMFDADTSNKYFRFIVRFDNSHQAFCREFLQNIGIAAPSEDIFNLYALYELFEGPSLPNTKEMCKVTAALSQYALINSSRIQRIYARVTADLPRFLKEDLSGALQIIKWLQSVSRVVNDTNAAARLTDYVCKAFGEQTYTKSDPEGTIAFWHSIRNSEFAASAAKYFIDPVTTQSNHSYMQRFSASDITAYVYVYLDCAAFLGNVVQDEIRKVVNWGLENCYRNKDMQSAKRILKILTDSRHTDAQSLLLSIAGNTGGGYAEFVVMLLVEYDVRIVADEFLMMEFLKKLSVQRMEHLYGAILKCRAKVINRSIEIEQMIGLLDRLPMLSEKDRAEIFALLDQKVNLSDRNAIGIAKSIQKAVPQGTSCKNSAHILALDVLGDRRNRGLFKSIYSDLSSQDFPSIDDTAYISMLVDALLKAKLSADELYYAILLFSRQSAYITALVAAILGVTSSRQADEWNLIMQAAVKKQDPNLIDAIIKECAKMKQGEKALAQLSDLLSKRETRDYFLRLAQESLKIIRSQRPQSGFGRFFGGGK